MLILSHTLHTLLAEQISSYFVTFTYIDGCIMYSEVRSHPQLGYSSYFFSTLKEVFRIGLAKVVVS